MNLQNFFNKSFGLFLLLFLTATAVSAQNSQSRMRTADNQTAGIPVVKGNNLYCAGFIQTAPVDTSYEIVGAVNEKEQHIFAQGDLLYVSGGANRGVNVGDSFAVIRPRGEVKSDWTKKKNVGFYVSELGAVEVVRVLPEVSVVRVKNSCDDFLFGDLLQPIPQRVSPLFRDRGALDIFAQPSGKARGRILMSREGREMLGREQIVYIDLGADENVKVGDYLTIFRPLGTGNIVDELPDESVEARNKNFQSEEYRGGGEFSIMAARKAGDKAGGKVVTSNEAKSRRPKDLRRIVGEMVILNVKEKTATAVITRVAQEVHTGDYVELQ